MRIDKIEIDGFGKLHHVQLPFSEGFNLIVGDNESGKSTLCEFLLAMFYEFPNALKKNTRYDDGRKLYRPWKGDAFGGRVYFTDTDGTKYVLEKSFGKNKNADRSKLMLADTWETVDGGENAGERFFGLGREGFLKTLYVKCLDANASVGGEEILARLSNMETGADEDISYDRIKVAMEKAHAQIVTKTGRGGRIPVLMDKKRELEIEKMQVLRKGENLKEKQQELLLFSEQESTIRTKIKEMEKQTELAKEHELYENAKQAEQSRGALSASYKTACERLAELKANRVAMAQQTEQTVSQDAVNRVKELERQQIIAQSKAEEWDKNQAFLAKEAEKKQKNGQRMKTLFIVCAILFFLVGLAGFIVHPVLLTGFLPALASLVMLIGFKTKEPKMPKTASNPAEAELAAIQTELSNIFASCQVVTQAELEEKFRMQQQMQVKLPEIEKQIQKLEEETEQMLRSISEIRLPEEREYSELAKTYNGPALQQLQDTIRHLTQQADGLKENVHALQIDLTRETAGERNASVIESEILAVTEEIAELTKKDQAFQLAERWLERAHREIKENFAPRLNQSTGEIFSELTEGRYKDVRVGEEFALHYKNETGEITESSALSRGTYDLLYIALRLATLTVLFGGKVPTLILDDAFSQFDDTRYQKTISYIRNSKAFGQVLSFTCHREAVQILEKENIHMIDLNEEGVLEHGLQG